MKKSIFIMGCAAMLCGCHAGHEHERDDKHEHHEEHAGEIIVSEAQAEEMGIAVEEIRPAEMRSCIKASGQLVAASTDEQTIVAKTAGILSFTGGGLTEGAAVRAGQVIATVSAKDLQDGDPTDKARAEYEAAKAEYERAQKLVAERIISQREFEARRLRYETARAAAGVLQNAPTGGTAVTVPVSGFIKSRLAAQGDYVSIGQPVAVVTQSRRVQLRADVPAHFAARLHEITGANFRLAGSGETLRLEDFGGRLLSYGRSVTDGTPYVPVTFELDNRGNLTPGAFAEIWLLAAPRQNVISLPAAALTDEQGQKFVYVQTEHDAYVKRAVTTGETDGTRIEICSGLKPGERVAVKGAIQIKLAAAGSAIPEHGHSH